MGTTSFRKDSWPIESFIAKLPPRHLVMGTSFVLLAFMSFTRNREIEKFRQSPLSWLTFEWASDHGRPKHPSAHASFSGCQYRVSSRAEKPGSYLPLGRVGFQVWRDQLLDRRA